MILRVAALMIEVGEDDSVANAESLMIPLRSSWHMIGNGGEEEMNKRG